LSLGIINKEQVDAMIFTRQKVSIAFSLREKLIILLMALIIIPFFIIGYVTYNKYSASVQKTAINTTRNLVTQININLNNYIKELDRLTMMPFYDNDVLDILKNHADENKKSEYISLSESEKMNLFISSISYNRPEIRGILIIANDGAMFSNFGYYDLVRMYNDRNWFEMIANKDSDIFIIPPHYECCKRD